MMRITKRYWYVTRRFKQFRGKLVAYGYDVYVQYQGRSKRILRSTGLAIPRSKIRKLVKVLNGDL